MADLFDKAIDSAVRSPRFPTAPPRPLVLRGSEKAASPRQGQMWFASLWLVLLVAVLPEPVWPALLAPTLLGLAVFSARAALAARHERPVESSVMGPREALWFAAISGSLVSALWLAGPGVVCLLPIFAGLLWVSGRVLPATWDHLRADTTTTGSTAASSEMARSTLLDELPREERTALTQAFCRQSVRYTLEDASKALRLALTGRPRTEADVRSELGARYGDAVAEVVLQTAIRRKAVRCYGDYLALAMDGAYRAA